MQQEGGRGEFHMLQGIDILPMRSRSMRIVLHRPNVPVWNRPIPLLGAPDVYWNGEHVLLTGYGVLLLRRRLRPSLCEPFGRQYVRSGDGSTPVRLLVRGDGSRELRVVRQEKVPR